MGGAVRYKTCWSCNRSKPAAQFNEGGIFCNSCRGRIKAREAGREENEEEEG